jgi:hypothetical protein
MGTRSRIAVMHGDVCKSIYCHWDGYLEHNGAILQQHYDSSKANRLVSLGNLSSLGTVIGEAHPFSKFEITQDDPEYSAKLALYELAESEDWCTFYGRDRGETGVEWRVAHDFDSFLEQCESCGAEYYYINKDDVWYCGDMQGNISALTELSAALTELAAA